MLDNVGAFDGGALFVELHALSGVCIVVADDEPEIRELNGHTSHGIIYRNRRHITSMLSSIDI